VTLVVVLASVPMSARGEVLHHRDSLADVARSPIGSSVYAPIPTHLEGDVIAIRVSHGRRAIWVRVRLRLLTTTTNGSFHRFGIKSDRKIRSVAIDAFPGHWEGSATVTNGVGRPVPCAIRYRLDYALNQVRLRVPRACLHRPEWVRVGYRATIAGSKYAYVDDARRGVVGTATELRYGPRVWR
jgi:hypothetical protein